MTNGKAPPVKPIPDGYHTISTGLVFHDTNAAIEFYKKAFGAVEITRMPGPNGQGVMHAELRIGDSVLFLGDEYPGFSASTPKTLGGTTVNMHLHVMDVDSAFDRAIKAGATPVMPPADMFWGDRYGKITDPFGHSWGLATHIEDVSDEECTRRGQEWMAQAGTAN